MTPHRRLSVLVALVALAMVLSACGGSTPDSTEDATATLEPSPTAAPPETAAPSSVPPTDAPTEAPATDAPTGAPATDEPTDGPTDDPDPTAAACTGTDANREFFAQVAASVAWAVYCPVLPAGWFVEGGQYRLAGGGWLEITYEGPDGNSLEVRQGVPCTTDGCIPTGTELGPADYGDLAGTLLDVGSGRFAVVVDPGANPSWTIVGSELTADDLRTIAADLALVEG